MKKAQALLVTIMVLATIMTLVLAISFQSVTETQTSKLEEENKKALAAAEAALEVSIKTGNNSTLGAGGSPELSNITGFTGGATISSLNSNTFTTQAVEKDDQYTFYLSTYNPNTNPPSLGTTSTDEPITICYEAGSTNPALEVTVIKTDRIEKYAIDQDQTRITNASLSSQNVCPDNSFKYSYTIPSGANGIGTNAQLLIVKVLFNASKLYFSRSSVFPTQGKAATSEVNSTTGGVSKKVYLFQTYPQIPNDFFDTSF